MCFSRNQIDQAVHEANPQVESFKSNFLLYYYCGFIKLNPK